MKHLDEVKASDETKQAVESYVRKNYKRMFEGKTLIIREFEKIFTIQSHKDASPLILGKGILNK